MVCKTMALSSEDLIHSLYDDIFRATVVLGPCIAQWSTTPMTNWVRGLTDHLATAPRRTLF
jgi:hypothetical protein